MFMLFVMFFWLFLRSYCGVAAWIVLSGLRGCLVRWFVSSGIHINVDQCDSLQQRERDFYEQINKLLTVVT